MERRTQIEAVLVETWFAGTMLASDMLESNTSEFLYSDSALVFLRDGRFVVRFHASWRGWICEEREVRALRETGEIPLPSQGTVTLEIGKIEFRIYPIHTHTPAPVARRPSSLANAKATKYGAACLAVFVVLSALLHRSKASTKTAYFDGFSAPERWAHSETLVPSDTPAPSHRSTATKVQRHVAPRSEAASTESGLQRARAKAQGAGILSVPDGESWQELEQVVAGISFDSSAENAKSYGDLHPADVDARAGGWGHGIRKIGPGSGDGKHWGTVKTGDHGLASAEQTGVKYEANALTRPHKAAPPATDPKLDAIEESGIRYDAIRGQLGMRSRVLRRCFDSDDTTAHPSHLLVSLSISANGSVQEARVDNVEQAHVQSCVTKVLRSIRLAESSNGKSLSLQGFSFRI